MQLTVKESDGFKFIETNKDHKEVLVLLHGLFGALSNFRELLVYFKDRLNVVIPILPIYELPLKQTGLGGLVKYVDEFMNYKAYANVHLLGNSLGGHVAQLYAIAEPSRMQSLILTGSSGLFESAMGTSFPKRGNYEYIKTKAQTTFYDPLVATKELVDEVFSVVNDRNKALRVVVTAKSAVRHNLADKLHLIDLPSLLIWGKQDTITPPFVAEKFHELLRNSELKFIDKCGHAPMMERPKEFNQYLEEFLNKFNNGLE